MHPEGYLYNSYSSYLKHKYGAPAYRVAVDAGFSCPNRRDDRSGGCSYCDELGATAVYQRGKEADMARMRNAILPDGFSDLVLSGLREKNGMDERKAKIRQQVENSIGFLERRYGARHLLLYFQAFSNTFAPVDELRELYDYTLGLAPFRELIVSTRPDCISKANTALLASYKESHDIDVWAELGLQSAHDKTLARINRGHGLSSFIKSFEMLRESGIKLTVHLIFGLPGEDREQIMETVNLVAGLRPEGVKIHNLHVPVGTALFEEYMMGELTVPSGRRHLEYTIEAIERLPEETVIHRLTCDTPGHRLGAPRTFYKKGTFIEVLKREMASRGSRQGRIYKHD